MWFPNSWSAPCSETSAKNQHTLFLCVLPSPWCLWMSESLHLYSWVCFSHPRQWQTITTWKKPSSNLSVIKRKHTHTRALPHTHTHTHTHTRTLPHTHTHTHTRTHLWKMHWEGLHTYTHALTRAHTCERCIGRDSTHTHTHTHSCERCIGRDSTHTHTLLWKMHWEGLHTYTHTHTHVKDALGGTPHTHLWKMHWEGLHTHTHTPVKDALGGTPHFCEPDFLVFLPLFAAVAVIFIVTVLKINWAAVTMTHNRRMICLTTDACSTRRTRHVFITFALKDVIIRWKMTSVIIYSPSLMSIQSFFFCERRKLLLIIQQK